MEGEPLKSQPESSRVPCWPHRVWKPFPWIKRSVCCWRVGQRDTCGFVASQAVPSCHGEWQSASFFSVTARRRHHSLTSNGLRANAGIWAKCSDYFWFQSILFYHCFILIAKWREKCHGRGKRLSALESHSSAGSYRTCDNMINIVDLNLLASSFGFIFTSFWVFRNLMGNLLLAQLSWPPNLPRKKKRWVRHPPPSIRRAGF